MNTDAFKSTVAIFVLAFSTIFSGCGGSGNVRQEPAPSEVKIFDQMPVHGDKLSPFVELGSDWHLGANVAPSEAMQAAMSGIGMRGGITARHGRVADTASAGELAKYLGTLEEVDGEIGRQEGSLRVLLPTQADRAMEEYTTRAIRMVNAALPHHVRLRLDTERVEDDGTLVKTDVEPGTLVIVERDQPGEFTGFGGPKGHPPFEEWLAGRPRTNENVEAYTRLLERGYWNGGWVEIDPEILEPRRARGVDGTAEWEDRNALNAFVHELIHAMGISGHPDRERFTESVMSYSRNFENQHVLYGIDYDAILALYELIEPETRRVPLGDGHFRVEPVRKSEEQLVEELGAWIDSSTHILGELELDSGTVTFGARARNGLAQAWARGPRPFVVEGQPLQGSARWQGAILGMTPDEQAVVGDANLAVDLGALTGGLSFTAMEYWQARARPGAPGSGTQWGDGDLEYDVNVEGGTFVRTGGDDGVVTGTFFGREYEGMGGVLEREDLSAGFAGRRQ